MFSQAELKKRMERVSINRKVDKVTFINALKSISTPYVDIIFNNQDNEIIIKHPKGLEQYRMYAKNNA